MAFETGNKGGPGRPKGSKNQATAILRKNIIKFLKDELPEVIEDFQHLRPGQRVRFYTDLLKFGLPQLQSSSVDVNLEKLPEQDLDKLILTIIEKNEQKQYINYEQIPVTANESGKGLIPAGTIGRTGDGGGSEGSRHGEDHYEPEPDGRTTQGGGNE